MTVKAPFVGRLVRGSVPALQNAGLYAVILVEPNSRLSPRRSHLLRQRQQARSVLTDLVVSLDQEKVACGGSRT